MRNRFSMIPVFLFLSHFSLLLPGSFSFAQTVSASSVYYVDADNGNDSNTGYSDKTAWKTLAKINTTSFRPGDQVLLKSGSIFSGELHISSSGNAANKIVVSAYGKGNKPRIVGNDSSMAAITLFNAEYVEISNLHLINNGKERIARRSGIKVEIQDFGTAHQIILKNLDIADVNGSFIKNEGGGQGFLIKNGGAKISNFDGLLIEGCTIRRCERNAIIFSSQYWPRNNWHPNLNVIIRGNLIEEVPGDGIVPIGCDGALMEYNVVRNCPKTLPEGEAAAGIWPWSCDNTIVQFNEASDHKALWDAQGFDADYNCRNTLIQYNYSHHNEGGFLLICNAGNQQLPYNIGNIGTKAIYNLSINDGLRPQPARGKIFSPTIHIAGPVKNTTIANNILYVNKKPSQNIDRTLINSDSWDGFSDSTLIDGNIFFTEENSQFLFGESTSNFFEKNYYTGVIGNKPADENAKDALKAFGLEQCFNLLKENPFVHGAKIIDKEKMENYFKALK